MTRTYFLAVCLAALAAPFARAGEMKAELDGSASGRLLATNFARYGYLPTRTLNPEGPGVRVRLPSGVKGVGQTGVYSFFALAGDFEITAVYNLLAFPTPQTGYGVSCGIGVDTDGPGGSLNLARSQQVGKPSGYLVSRGFPGEGGLKYEDATHVPAKAKTGRLVLRREKAELVCLVADDLKETPREIGRVPFTTATVRKLRLYADPGGSPSAIDAWVGSVKVRAEEITGGIPLRDAASGWVWWLAGAALVAGAIAFVVVWRRRKAREEG